MENQKIEPMSLNVHSVYGTIYKDGEFVQRGAVLGLSVDTKAVVIAPISGWVRVVSLPESANSLCVEIWQQPHSEGEPEAQSPMSN